MTPTSAEMKRLGSQVEDRTGRTMSEMLAEKQVAGLGVDIQAMTLVSNLYRVAARMRNHFEQGILRETGLTWTGFVTLWVLWIWGEMQTRHLADEVNVNRSTLSGVLSTLENKGLLVRRPHETEGRLVLVELTDSGRDLISTLYLEFNAEESFIVSRLSSRQQQQLTDALRVIHGLLEDEGEERRAGKQLKPETS
ncbi:MarR family winged helix-turn-helix transcriptional regulator [Aeromicrobium sp. Root344]|uniref:MarR family winged helix-turn-helix transcriptional regulator n=1 Tax=Aeromicrobium sp. Root344 TaxID=1736521 RepID=UPI0009EA07CE|nr:MarR family transcriptional regulator [Aeromicrobium sp. Root344]